MSRVSPLDENEGSGQTQLQKREMQSGEAAELHQLAASQATDALDGNADLLTRLSQLPSRTKATLIRKLLSQLETGHIQAILEFGLREIADRDQQNLPNSAVSHNTRLLLKKDYSYQERGLDEPTQYYVYLRRRKPKLDRYIGALFYVPTGCTLSYCLDAAERIMFNPPHNVFHLQDSLDASVTQLVRLIYLEPPPAAYTFSKQQDDTPEIRLHVEYLNPITYQPLSRQVYPFPACMYEGGALDRYRWEVSTVTLMPEPVQESSQSAPSKSLPAIDDSVPGRRVLELPATKPLTFELANPTDADAVLKRLRLWVTWSEKAMPQSRWGSGSGGFCLHVDECSFQTTDFELFFRARHDRLENSLPVLLKWFHDLSLAVSQTQTQRQYSAAQLKLAHNLFVETSLPQKEPLILLRKLFGVEFTDVAVTTED